MSSFIFNDVNSDDLGLIITQPIIRPTWQPEVEFTAIPGRPRQNPYTKTWYPNRELGVQAVIADASTSSVRDIYQALKGYGTLTISTASEEMLYAYARLPVPEAKALLMAELPIIFECEPFAYAVEPKSKSIMGEIVEVNNEGTAFVDPLITIIASQVTTTVTCNNVDMIVTTPTEIVDADYSSDYSITLDCDGQLAYYTRPNGDKVSCTQNTKGPFARLHDGKNYFTVQNVQAASIVYRERWY